MIIPEYFERSVRNDGSVVVRQAVLNHNNNQNMYRQISLEFSYVNEYLDNPLFNIVLE